MPEDKKNKSKGDAKVQRKPRRDRQTAVDKKDYKNMKKDEPKDTKVVAPSKPMYEEPGPEFYQNLKRETDEILKITEEANSKYKKKEIQSNWAKYEMPIDSYEEVEEQEQLGADYEKLIAAPLSLGGHFQFKHEKSWDIGTGPSLYDKYFDIDMENLAIALSTIPFYERNNIDPSIFTEADKLNMINRSVRYKQKYYNDKSFTTPELDVNDKILNSLKDNAINENPIEMEEEFDNDSATSSNIVLESNINVSSNNTIPSGNIYTHLDKDKCANDKELDGIDDILLENITNEDMKTEKKTESQVPVKSTTAVAINLPADSSTTPKPGQVLESPADLERWLDDFLQE